MSEPSASPAAPVSDSAMTAALIREITAEARSSGRSLVHDPDAPPDADGDDAGEPASGQTRTQKRKDSNAEDSTESPEDSTESDSGDDQGDEQGDDPEQAEPQGEINAERVKQALAREGGVDMLELAEALGVPPEALKVTPATHKALRIAQKRAREMAASAEKLSRDLQAKYGEQGAALDAAAKGDLTPAIEFIEKTFGMPWNELNRMVAGLMQGKPAKDLHEKRELLELRKKAAEREEADKKAAAERAQQQKVSDAKQWIANSIKGDKLATDDLNRQLSEAGFPTITDLVFEEMAANYKNGLTDPKKALDRVKAKLSKQARALQAVGFGTKPAPAKPRPTTSSRPRAEAQSGAEGNARPMNDKELREAVLKEAGLWRSR